MAVPRTKSVASRNPEGEFLAGCVRFALGLPVPETVEGLFRKAPRRELLVRLAARHRVIPDLHAALESIRGAVPDPLWLKVHNLHLRKAADNHMLFGDLVRLVELLARKEVPAVVFRGPVMALALYGDLAKRQFADVDLLIRRRHVAAATEVLVAEGYTPQFRLRRGQQAALVHFQDERFFIRAADRRCVDLHWRLLPRCFAFERSEKRLWERCVPFRVGDATLAGLSDEDLALFLCIHGAKHGWAQLALVKDLARLISLRKDLDWEKILATARRKGKTRMVMLGLHLAGEVLGAPLDPALLDRAARYRAVNTLASVVRRRMFGGTKGEGTDEKEWYFVLNAMERARDIFRYLAYLALIPSGIEIQMVPLPRVLAWFYYPIRWIRLLVKHVIGGPLRHLRRTTRPAPARRGRRGS